MRQKPTLRVSAGAAVASRGSVCTTTVNGFAKPETQTASRHHAPGAAKKRRMGYYGRARYVYPNVRLRFSKQIYLVLRFKLNRLFRALFI